jgi:hypothetical protein
MDDNPITPEMQRILEGVRPQPPPPRAEQPKVEKRKVCADCKRPKNLHEFYRDRGKRKAICKACWLDRYRSGTRRRLKRRNPYDCH